MDSNQPVAKKEQSRLQGFFTFKVGSWVWYVLWFAVGMIWVTEVYDQVVANNIDAAINAGFAIFFMALMLVNEVMHEDLRKSIWNLVDATSENFEELLKLTKRATASAEENRQRAENAEEELAHYKTEAKNG